MEIPGVVLNVRLGDDPALLHRARLALDHKRSVGEEERRLWHADLTLVPVLLLEEFAEDFGNRSTGMDLELLARHVTQVTAGSLEKNNAHQPYLGFTYIKSLSRKPNHYTQFAMRVGERVDGVSFDVYKHTLKLNAPLKTSISNGIKLYTSQTKSEGATLLGVDRDTNVLKVGALIDKKIARFDVSYGVELESSASSIEGFSYQRVNYLLNVKF